MNIKTRIAHLMASFSMFGWGCIAALARYSLVRRRPPMINGNACDMSSAREYRKTVAIRAVQMPGPFDVMTREGLMEGRASDWLAIGVHGERWIISDTFFKASYERGSIEGAIKP